jgi:hypothetical protein
MQHKITWISIENTDPETGDPIEIAHDNTYVCWATPDDYVILTIIEADNEEITPESPEIAQWFADDYGWTGLQWERG